MMQCRISPSTMTGAHAPTPMQDLPRPSSSRPSVRTPASPPAQLPLWPILLFVFSVTTAVTAWQGLRPSFNQGWMTLGYSLCQALVSTLIIWAADRARWSGVKALVTFTVLALCLLPGMQRHRPKAAGPDLVAEQQARARIEALLEEARQRANSQTEPRVHRDVDHVVNDLVEWHLSQRRTFQPELDRLALDALSTPSIVATETGRQLLSRHLLQAQQLASHHQQQMQAQFDLALQAVQDEPLPPMTKEALMTRLQALRPHWLPMQQRRWELQVQALQRRQAWLTLLTQSRDRWQPQGQLFAMKQPAELAMLTQLAGQIAQAEGESVALDRETRHMARQVLTAP